MKKPQTFEAVRRQGAATSQVEVCSDSLNTKSEEKKFNSISYDEEHRSSPSFYKIDTSENDLEGEIREDLGKDDLHNSYIPASSFASGA